jgi:hypothetical protein
MIVSSPGFRAPRGVVYYFHPAVLIRIANGSGDRWGMV